MITHDTNGTLLAVGDLIWTKRGFYSSEGYHVIREITPRSLKTIRLRPSEQLDQQTKLRHITYVDILFVIDIGKLNDSNIIKTLAIQERDKVVNGQYAGAKEQRERRVLRAPPAHPLAAQLAEF